LFTRIRGKWYWFCGVFFSSSSSFHGVYTSLRRRMYASTFLFLESPLPTHFAFQAMLSSGMGCKGRAVARKQPSKLGHRGSDHGICLIDMVFVPGFELGLGNHYSRG